MILNEFILKADSQLDIYKMTVDLKTTFNDNNR